MKAHPLLLLTLISTTAAAKAPLSESPYFQPDVIISGPNHCRAPGPDECWDMTGQQKLKWVCNHCVNVGEISKPRDPCVIEIHSLATDIDALIKGGPLPGVPSGTLAQACFVKAQDPKYPLPPNVVNGLDSVAGAYDQGTKAASDAEAGVANLAQTANDSQARICAISKKVTAKAAEAEDKLIDAEANLGFVKEYDRIGQAIKSVAGSKVLETKKCFAYGNALNKLHRRYLLIGKSCVGEAYATKKANVKKSRAHLTSLKKTLEAQCYSERSLEGNASVQNPAANESDSTISEAK